MNGLYLRKKGFAEGLAAGRFYESPRDLEVECISAGFLTYTQSDSRTSESPSPQSRESSSDGKRVERKGI